jgi:hypothetical protein
MVRRAFEAGWGFAVTKTFSLDKGLKVGRRDIKHNETQHNDTQHNDTQHNDTQHNATQHIDTQHTSRKAASLLCWCMKPLLKGKAQYG